MQLYVCLVPPTEVRNAVGAIVREACVAGVGLQLDQVAPDRMELPVATFGNVAAGDAAKIEQAVRAATTTLTAPTVHLAGSAALEFTGDTSVWAKMDGDLDELRLIPPAITRAVEGLGFYVDRRRFRPMLSVATITDATGIEVLQAVVDALDAFQGEPWTIESVSLRERLLGSTPPGSRELARIPLGSG